MDEKHDGVDCLVGSACSRNNIEDLISVTRKKAERIDKISY